MTYNPEDVEECGHEIAADDDVECPWCGADLSNLY
jgi:hypothetical protein